MSFTDFWLIDFAPLLAAILSGICCTLCGNFLLVRGHSMTVDALSHMVLPGMVIAFFIAGSISFFYMFWGALAAALIGTILIELLGRIQDRNAVMGMVFSVMFAMGILLLEVFVDRRVHFDVTHILFGSLESVYWVGLGTPDIGVWDLLGYIPSSIAVLIFLVGLISLLIILFYKEILLICFDYEFARCTIKGARLIYYGIPIIITMTVVGAFRLVGLILIVGMFIIPPLIASLFASSIASRIFISCLLSVALCLAGYSIAVYVPIYMLNEGFSLNVGGTIVTTGGVLLFLILLWKQLFRINDAGL